MNLLNTSKHNSSLWSSPGWTLCTRGKKLTLYTSHILKFSLQFYWTLLQRRRQKCELVVDNCRIFPSENWNSMFPLKAWIDFVPLFLPVWHFVRRDGSQNRILEILLREMSRLFIFFSQCTVASITNWIDLKYYRSSTSCVFQPFWMIEGWGQGASFC